MKKGLLYILIALTCLTTPLQAIPLRGPSQDPRIMTLKRSEIPQNSKYILEVALNNQIQITEKMKKEFWDGFSEYGTLSYDQREYLRDKLVGAEVILTAYLYRDILISIYLNQPYKSSLRNGYEQHLMKLGIINEFNINEFDKLTTKMIESEKSEKVAEDQPKKTRQGLLQLITKSSQREKRINQLFGVEKLAPISYPAVTPMINESRSTLLDPTPESRD